MEEDIGANSTGTNRWAELLGEKKLDARTSSDTRRLQYSKLPTHEGGFENIVRDLLRLGYDDVLQALFDEPPFPMNRLSLSGAVPVSGDAARTAWTVLLRRLLCNDASAQPVELKLGGFRLCEHLIRELADCLSKAGPPLSLSLSLSDTGDHEDVLFGGLQASEKLRSLTIEFWPQRDIPQSFSTFIEQAQALAWLSLKAPQNGLPAHLAAGLSTNRTIEMLSLSGEAQPAFGEVLLALRAHPQLKVLELGQALTPADVDSLGVLLSSAPQLKELRLFGNVQPGSVIPKGSLAKLEFLSLQASSPIEFAQSVLAELCEPHVMRSFGWYGAEITPRMQALLTRWLSGTVTLKELQCRRTSPASVQAIVDAVAGNRTLECFELDHVADAELPGFSIEKLTACAKLETFILSMSVLTEGACKQIAFLMANHPGLARLGLQTCRLEAGGIEQIASRLAGSSRILQLDVSGSLSMADFRLLLKSLALNKGLRGLHAGGDALVQELITVGEVEQWLADNFSLVDVTAEGLALFDPDARQRLVGILTRNLRLSRRENIAHLRHSLRGFMQHKTGVAELGDLVWDGLVDKLPPDGEEEVLSSEEALRGLVGVNTVARGSNEIFRVGGQPEISTPDIEDGPARKRPRH